MTYAIIETGGKQLRVEVGRFYDVDRLPLFTLDQVLFVDNDGEASIGQPLVEGATVEATVLRHFRGRKIIVYKMQPKKKTRKKQGHRQELTRVMVNAISLGGSALVSDQTSAEAAPVSVASAEVASAEVASAETED